MAEQSGRHRDELRVRLVQRASGLEPAENRAALETSPPLPGDDRPRGASPRRSPATSASPAPISRRTPSRSTGPSPSGPAASAARPGRPGWPGCSRRADDPARPLNTLVLAEDEQLTAYREDPPLRLLRLPGVRHDQRRARSSPARSTSRGFPLGLMTCYDLRFPELARHAGRAGRRGARRPRGLGRRRAQGRALAHAAAGPRHREHGLGDRGRSAGPRYTGHSMVVAPDGDVVVEADEDEAVLDAVDRPRGGRRRTPHQPLARQPPACEPRRYASRACPAVESVPGRRASPARARRRPRTTARPRPRPRVDRRPPHPATSSRRRRRGSASALGLRWLARGRRVTGGLIALRRRRRGRAAAAGGRGRARRPARLRAGVRSGGHAVPAPRSPLAVGGAAIATQWAPLLAGAAVGTGVLAACLARARHRPAAEVPVRRPRGRARPVCWPRPARSGSRASPSAWTRAVRLHRARTRAAGDARDGLPARRRPARPRSTRGWSCAVVAIALLVVALVYTRGADPLRLPRPDAQVRPAPATGCATTSAPYPTRSRCSSASRRWPGASPCAPSAGRAGGCAPSGPPPPRHAPPDLVDAGCTAAELGLAAAYSLVLRPAAGLRADPAHGSSPAEAVAAAPAADAPAGVRPAARRCTDPSTRACGRCLSHYTRGRSPRDRGPGGVPERPIGTALKAVAGRDVSRGFESRPLCRRHRTDGPELLRAAELQRDRVVDQVVHPLHVVLEVPQQPPQLVHDRLDVEPVEDAGRQRGDPGLQLEAVPVRRAVARASSQPRAGAPASRPSASLTSESRRARSSATRAPWRRRPGSAAVP